MKTMIALVCLMAAANAGAFELQGVDAKAVKAGASAELPGVPDSRFGLPTYSSRDCRKVEFTADSPLTSADISLRSMTMYQDCQNFGQPVGQICTNRPEYYNETTRVTVTEPRELQPGQKEVFEVCLWGQFLQIRPVETVYKYKSKVTFEGIYITPQGLIAPKAETRAAAAGFCALAMDSQYSCIYRCADGQYVTQQKPFPNIPAPNPWVGPINYPCRPGIPQPQTFAGLN